MEKLSTSDLSKKVARLIRICSNLDIPILFIVDGRESSGRGLVVRNLIRDLAAKSYDVEVFEEDDEEDKDPYRLIKKIRLKIPEKGKVKIFDQSYYSALFKDRKLEGKVLDAYASAIKTTEKMLYDDRTIIIKLFLEIGAEEQKDRISKIKEPRRSFYITGVDKMEMENYGDFKNHFEKVLCLTNFSFSPRHKIDTNNLKKGSKDALFQIMEDLTIGLERVGIQEKSLETTQRAYKPNLNVLENLDLNKEISDEDYEKKKKLLQEEVADTVFTYYDKGIPQILVFEGVDAAGKDGSIERLIKDVDPRLYKVHGISAPSEEELARNYLRRFFNRFPEDGKLAIFSRSRYGRVMVERVEGFAKVGERDRAYGEIAQMENILANHGTLIIKFFVMIDKDEQLKRFLAREANPDKNYKLTDEDRRNRAKRDDYLASMDEMLERTNLPYAPRVVVEGNQKHYARIKVMEEYLRLAKDHLKKLDK